jgi:hypothetical protein
LAAPLFFGHGNTGPFFVNLAASAAAANGLLMKVMSEGRYWFGQLRPRRVGHLRQQFGDLPISPLRCVLVAHGCGRCRMPKSPHQFRQCGACSGCEYCTAVTQIMPAEIISLSLGARLVELPVQGRGCQMPAAMDGREQQSISLRSHEPLEVVFDRGQEVRWDLDIAATGIGFRCGDLEPISGADHGPRDADDAVGSNASTPSGVKASVCSTMMMSRRCSSVSSPNLKAHQAASNTMARYCSGISWVITAISSRDAGRILCTLRALPAPRITQGLTRILPSDRALPVTMFCSHHCLQSRSFSMQFVCMACAKSVVTVALSFSLAKKDRRLRLVREGRLLGFAYPLFRAHIY